MPHLSTHTHVSRRRPPPTDSVRLAKLESHSSPTHSRPTPTNHVCLAKSVCDDSTAPIQAPSLDSTVASSTSRNQIRKSADDHPARPVFSDAEINDLLSSCPEIREEEYPKEIEDRLYPITTADVRMQTDRIRERRKNPAQDEILKTLNLLPSDAHLLLAPADIEDEAKWYAWFADTLNKCGEAKRANRDFKISEAVAHIQWVDPNPYDVLCEAGDEFDDSPCPGLYA
ncbi:hypothetical protein AaE_013914, partial [Aphanomyces astaci]